MYAVFGITQCLSFFGSLVPCTIYLYLQRTFEIHNSEPPLKSVYLHARSNMITKWKI